MGRKSRYVGELAELHKQYPLIGVDYNYLVKSLNTAFIKKKPWSYFIGWNC